MSHYAASHRVSKHLGLTTVLLLLAACGGGGDGGSGNAVSSSPVAPSGTAQVADAGRTSVPAAPASGVDSPNNVVPGSPAVSPSPGATQTQQPVPTPQPVPQPAPSPVPEPAPVPAPGPDDGKTDIQKKPQENPVAPNTASPSGNAAQQPPLLDGKLSGDALMTMLDTHAPVYTVWWPQMIHANPIPNILYPVASRDGELLPKPDSLPGIEVSSGVTPNGYDCSNVSRAVFGFACKYGQVRGDFEIHVGANVTTVEGVSSQATSVFRNMNFSLKGNAAESDFTLGSVIVFETSSGSPVRYGDSEYDEFRRTYEMVSEQSKTYSRTAYFPANEPIQVWRTGSGSATLFWRPGPGARDVDLCWNVDFWVVKRLQCSTWTLQEGWVRGQRFAGGGVYMEDDRSAIYHNDIHENGEYKLRPETGKHLWRLDGRSIDLFHG